MDNAKLFLKNDGFVYSIEALENINEALDVQQNNKSYMRFIERIAEQAQSINDHFNPNLEKLLWSDDWKDRVECVEQNYRLDTLVYDSHEYVRKAIVEQGACLDKLVNDLNAFVREHVAHQDYDLETLVNDPSEYVRVEVARQGYGLNKLVNDPEWKVRINVALQGYGLDKLVNDPNNQVRKIVHDKVRELGFQNIVQWKKANPDKCAL